ncbi:MAG: hypothetical protein JO021_06350, partial [Alphaproteobacteria bacterium]|nr:hypothetical protein [Alphaproteobacteria bacterium]
MSDVAHGRAGASAAAPSVESARSWAVAFAVLAILTCSYGAPLVVSVGLKDIAADLG